MGLFSFNSGPKKHQNWIELTEQAQLIKALESSHEKPVLFFKHSTRCSISSMAFSRFEQEWNFKDEQCDLYYLDLLAYRSISNELAELSGIFHQSPQVIVFKNGKAIYSASHSSIDANQILALL